MYKTLPLLPIHRALRRTKLHRIWRGRRHRRGQRRNLQRGMTLLEVMIVMAILALIMGLVVGPKVMAMFDEAKKRTAATAVKKFAFEEYPMWAQTNPDKSCPADMKDLTTYSNSKEIQDPWQKPYRLLCGPTLPPGVSGIGVASNGPDGVEGNGDDITSWQ